MKTYKSIKFASRAELVKFVSDSLNGEYADDNGQFSPEAVDVVVDRIILACRRGEIGYFSEIGNPRDWMA